MIRWFVIALAGVVALANGGCSGQSGPQHNGTNVLLIMLDTVRADRLSCYGNERLITPNIDEIARRGVRFENFYSNSSWTLPSHASLFTGMYSVGHRATQETLSLNEKPATVAEVFSRAGYQTLGVSSNGIVSIRSGLARGFGEFVEAFRPTVREELMTTMRGHPNNISFKKFLDSSSREEPFFVFLNYIEAHAPYTPPEPVRELFVDSVYTDAQVAEAMRKRMPDHYMYESVTDEHFAILNQLYDAEVAYLDRAVGNLMRLLSDDGRLENTIVIVMSDHGENIGDHGHFAHVFSIYDTLLRVPLVIMYPDGTHAGTTRSETAQIVDMFPTLLAQCGVQYRGRQDGRDLFAEGAGNVTLPAMAEYYYPRQVLSVFDEDELRVNVDQFLPFMRRLRALHDGDHKLISSSNGMVELYDVRSDPGETRDLLLDSPDHPAKAEMLATLERLVAEHEGEPPLEPPPPPGWMMAGFEERLKQDPELLKQLRSLGYVR